MYSPDTVYIFLRFIAAWATWIISTVYFVSLPFLTSVVLDRNVTFALQPDGKSTLSISYYTSTSPAAGVFGATITTPIVIALSLPRLTKTFGQIVSLVFMYISAIFVLAVPLTAAPDMHRVATGVSFGAIALNSIVHGSCVSPPENGKRDIVSISMDITLASIISMSFIGLASQFTDVGSTFYAIEVIVLTLTFFVLPAATTSDVCKVLQDRRRVDRNNLRL